VVLPVQQCLETDRNKYASEGKEYGGYIELITKLSDEREGIALEYELENKELKGCIEELTQQLASMYNCTTLLTFIISHEITSIISK